WNMRRQIPDQTWVQIDLAVAAGIGPREIARNMGLPAGTVLAHVSRKKLSQQIQTAKATARPAPSQKEITALESVEKSIQERGQKHVERMATVSEKVMGHIESLPPGEVFGDSRNLDYYDRVARRTFNLDNQLPQTSPINFQILCNGGGVIGQTNEQSTSEK